MIILHYIPSIDRGSGGVGSYMQLLAKHLGELVELHVVTHQSENGLALENCHLHYIHYFSLINSGKLMKEEFDHLLMKIRPDIIQINGCWLPGCAYAAIWAKRAGYKVVLCPHGMLEPWDIKKNYWTKKLPALLLYQKGAIMIVDSILEDPDDEIIALLSGYGFSQCRYDIKSMSISIVETSQNKQNGCFIQNSLVK